MTLRLVLAGEWWHAVKLGIKTIEYREMKPYWETRIWNKRDEIACVRFELGYGGPVLEKSVTKIDIGPCPYEGWDGEYYRIHFE